MVSLQQELHSAGLRRETERALEKAIQTDVDPHEEYRLLVWVLQRISHGGGPHPPNRGVPPDQVTTVIKGRADEMICDAYGETI